MDSSSSINPSTTTTTTSSTSSSSSSSGSELFICFNTRRRLTTRISARPSILSPARDPQISLSTCRTINSSRRLRSSGSTTRNRGGRSSPMFAAAAAKKRASGFDNPEPSSPKVTCIGQVRVKPKKKGIKLRNSRSRRRQSGEVSFRTLDQIQRQSSYNNTQFRHSRNQRWVHLPSSICDSFNCLIPCKSPCVCENDKGDKHEVINEVKVVQPNFKKEEEMEMLPMRSARRHIFDEIEINNNEGFQVKDGEEEGENVNVSVPPKNALLLMRSRSDPVKMDEDKNVNVPPKNALLLMRCRSDPVKMEALVNRCWEPQLPKQLEDDDDDEQAEEQVVEDGDIVDVEQVEMEDRKDLKASEKGNEQEETGDEKRLVVEVEDEKENNLVNVLGVNVDEESEEDDDDEMEAMEDKNEDESRVSYSNASFSLQTDDDISEADDDHELPTLETDTVDVYAEKLKNVKILEEKITHEEKLQDIITKTEDTEDHATAIAKRESEVMKEEERKRSKLPDCLLLMMCEPKLSMEVSKETWVSKTDFAQEQVKMEKVSGECNASLASCTFPASMAAMIEQKLVNAAAYEPFVLTRCKSAPIRRAGALQLPPDGWFWKNEGLLQKHGRGGFGIGAPELVAFQLSR